MSRLPFAARASAPAEGFRHEAFLYSGDQHFVEGAAAFVRGALDADDAVLVAVVEPRASQLRQALGRDADRVEFLDIAHVGRNPARIIPAWQDWVGRHASAAGGCRGIGELVWAGRTPEEIVECEHHERLLNTAFGEGRPWWLLCVYDVAALPGTVVEHAHDAHPTVVEGDQRKHSASYPRPDLGSPAIMGEPLPEPADAQAAVEVDFDLDGLGELRDRVLRYAEPVVGEAAAADAVLVVNELAANSIKYGGGAGTLRLWREGPALLCEVRDGGVITDPLVGCRRPSVAPSGKAGLWIANQVCDLLQIRSARGRGTVVRARLGGAAAVTATGGAGAAGATGGAGAAAGLAAAGA